MSGAPDTSERAEDLLGVPNDFSAMLNKVLSNPQIIATVASALSDKSSEKTEPTPIEERVSKDNSELSYDVEAMMQKLPQMMKVLSPMMSGGAKGAPSPQKDDKRACLLHAIKPYLNPARQEAVDYIIKFSQISEILKALN